MGSSLIDIYKRDAHALYNEAVAALINDHSENPDKDQSQAVNPDKYIKLMHQYMRNEYGFNYLLAIEFNADMYNIYGVLKGIVQNFHEMELRTLGNIHLFRI